MTHETWQHQLKYWWLLLISGLLSIGLAIATFSNPLEAYLGLALAFALTFFVAGILEVIYALQVKKNDRGWVWILTGGIVGIISGIFLFSSPELTMVVMPIYLGSIILFRSIFEAAHAFEVKKMGLSGWGWVLFAAMFGILFAILIIANTVLAGTKLIIYTGLALLSLGISQIIVSLRLRALNEKHR